MKRSAGLRQGSSRSDAKPPGLWSFEKRRTAGGCGAPPAVGVTSDGETRAGKSWARMHAAQSDAGSSGCPLRVESRRPIRGPINASRSCQILGLTAAGAGVGGAGTGGEGAAEAPGAGVGGGGVGAVVSSGLAAAGAAVAGVSGAGVAGAAYDGEEYAP